MNLNLKMEIYCHKKSFQQPEKISHKIHCQHSFMTSNGTYTVEQIKNDYISSRNVKQIMCNEQKNDS